MERPAGMVPRGVVDAAPPPKVLVIDDDPGILSAMERLLGRVGFHCLTSQGGEGAVEVFRSQAPDVVLLDYWMPGMNGAELLEALARVEPRTPVILVTGSPTMDAVVSTAQRGVFEVLTKPVTSEQLQRVIGRALQSQAGATPHADACDACAAPDELCLGSDPAMVEIWKLVGAATRPGANGNILLTGDTGVGKTMLARLIHGRSARSAQPFVTVHCAGVPPDLLANELFGHESGAYTGADARQMGRIEAAGHGTLFLDEIAELSPQLQVKLLRLLDDGEYERLGSTQTRVARCRFVAATNVDVDRALARGELRADLFHRLSVVRIHLPALRERAGDIVPMARHFLGCISQKLGTAFRLSPEAEALLASHELPGNVRQLRHVLEHAATVAHQGLLLPAHFSSLAVRSERPAAPPSDEGVPAPRQKIPGARPFASTDLETARNDAMALFERQYLEDLLDATQGNVTRASKEAGVSRQYLQRLLKKHQLDPAARRRS